MISLFLDTCSHNIIVGILEDNKLIYSKIEENDNKLSEKLFPYISEAFKEINKDIHDIDSIYVANGPGSFTGIRIGVTVAKTIAWALNKRIVTVSEIEVLASTKTEKKYICPLIDARRGCVYTGIYNNELEVIKEPKYISLETFLEQNNKIINDCSMISYDDIMENIENPVIDIEKIVLKHKDDKSLNPHEVNPEYLKLTEAEEKLIDKTN